MNLIKSLVGSAVIALVVSGALVYFVDLTRPDIVVEEDGKVITVEGPRGPAGAQGAKGNTGAIGPIGLMGPVGPKGLNGSDGQNAVVNISVLTDAVADELEDRQNAFSIDFSGSGDSVETLNLSNEDADNYEFKIRNFASGDFIVSLEDADGSVVTIVNTTGHANVTLVRAMNDESYKIHISSDGAWTIDVEQN